MRAVLQRVNHGQVRIDGNSIANIDKGLVILLGISPEDTPKFALGLANKIAQLRIFDDADGKMNLSILDIQGEAIVVSQFTLFANTRKGRRPSFIGAAKPELAEPLVKDFVKYLEKAGVPTKEGKFGAHMVVEIENDGPVTILMDFPPV